MFAFLHKISAKIQQKPVAVFLMVSGLFLLFYGLVSLVPHFNFRSNAFDLGIFNQTLSQYAHLKMGPNTLREVPTLLADHFEPIMFLFAPLYWLFGSYTLLLVQVAAVVFGAFGVFLLLQKETKDSVLALGGVILFYLSFGLVEAMAYDYHNNVVGTMFIPWLFFLFSERKFFWYYVVLALFLLCKENLALVAVFLGLSFLIFGETGSRKHGTITLVMGLLYFILALKVFIPFFNHGAYDHWSYTQLGQTPATALVYIVTHPFQTFWLFFNDSQKLKFWVIFLLSGGVLVFLKPKYALVLVPLLAQKFLSDNLAFWGITFQYSVEFAPIIALGSVLALVLIKNHHTLHCHCKIRNDRDGHFVAVSYVGLGLLIFLNFVILSQIHFFDGSSVARLADIQYYSNVARNDLQQAINLIPPWSSVTAQNTLVPHLTDHDELYLFPKNVFESQYVVLNFNDTNFWPLQSSDELEFYKNKLDKSSTMTKIFDSNGVVLYRKNTGS